MESKQFKKYRWKLGRERTATDRVRASISSRELNQECVENMLFVGSYMCGAVSNCAMLGFLNI
jgi:hypothetical protein